MQDHLLCVDGITGVSHAVSAVRAGDPFEQLVNYYLDNRSRKLAARLGAGVKSGLSRFTAFVKKHRRTGSNAPEGRGVLSFLLTCLVYAACCVSSTLNLICIMFCRSACNTVVCSTFVASVMRESTDQGISAM